MKIVGTGFLPGVEVSLDATKIGVTESDSTTIDATVPSTVAIGIYDVIVTNPPFHQGHAEDRGLTDRLLQGAAAHLVEGGIVVVVAQRHRELHRRLRRWFGRVETVSAHPSHVVFVAALPRRAGG